MDAAPKEQWYKDGHYHLPDYISLRVLCFDAFHSYLKMLSLEFYLSHHS